MKQSQLFSKTRKEAPKDETAQNAKLLIKGGFIQKEMAGVYSFLPLGLRVLSKVNSIIREEMNKAKGQEVFLSALQKKETWERTDRWNSKNVDVWFKTNLVSGGEIGLGFTHEEPLTALMKDHIRSFRDLPVYVYQIQTKFRNETRSKSGLMRTREFLMKDLYSFSRDEKEHSGYYELMKSAYKSVFDKTGIGGSTFLTYASGGTFSKYSHEFQTLCETGEDIIHLCEKCSVAVNDEIIGELSKCPECGNPDLKKKKAVEVGNIFNLGTKFSEALGLRYVDEKNETKPVYMGSYGIGPARLIGVAVELFSGEDKIIWPINISPFKTHILILDDEAEKQSAEVLGGLEKAGLDVLVDDRKARAGEKFADADLIGIPIRVIVSSKTLKSGKIEVENRISKVKELLSVDDAVQSIIKDVQG